MSMTSEHLRVQGQLVTRVTSALELNFTRNKNLRNVFRSADQVKSA